MSAVFRLVKDTMGRDDSIINKFFSNVVSSGPGEVLPGMEGRKRNSVLNQRFSAVGAEPIVKNIGRSQNS